MAEPGNHNPANESPQIGPSGQAPTQKGVVKPPRSWRRLMLWAGGAGLVFMGVAAAGVEYYTGLPSFCRSCHIMEPYWQSWSKDVHGKEMDVRCVDCHYAPGERFTPMAKFKGLSQAVSYFSGRYGTARPRAHVVDASCLQSGCHGEGEHVDRPLPIGEVRTETRVIGDHVTQVQRAPTVMFVHQTHLDGGERLKENTRHIDELTQRLRDSMPPDAFVAIETMAKSVGPMDQQIEDLQAELEARGMAEYMDDGLELFRLYDLRGRLNQLAGLTCASCHGYDATGQNHFAVDLQACYTCHFTNQGFNAGTGTCLNCHTPPTRQIFVHGPPTMGQTPSIMDHQDILERNIDCASCHLDVVQGRSLVTARDCARCHDQERYLEDFETRDIETVEEYHRVHVAAQRARCQDCHQSVRHELIEPTLVTTSAGFVQPILNDCQHCHPDHHREQVEMFMGTAGVGIEHPMPNAMFGSRVNCRACHTEPGTDFMGRPLVEATAATCIACHEETYGDLLDQWINELAAYLEESDQALELVSQRMEEHQAQGHPVPDRAKELVDKAVHNIHLVRMGNGIHNKNYAIRLLDVSDGYLREAIDILARAAATNAEP